MNKDLIENNVLISALELYCKNYCYHSDVKICISKQEKKYCSVRNYLKEYYNIK